MKKSKIIVHCTIFAIIFSVIGEFNLRILGIEKRIEWQVDENLFSRLSPSQRGYIWLGSMGEKSPAITVNRYGLRGGDINPGDDSFKILSIGSSSALGVGVKDNETFTAKLENMSLNNGELVSVYNAANPGWGPFHWDAFLKHEAEILKPNLILISTSYGDLSMAAPVTVDKKKEYLKKERMRKDLLSKSLFLKFSIRKLLMIKERLKNRIKKEFSTVNNTQIEPLSAGGKRFVEILKNNDKYFSSMIIMCKKKRWPIIFFIRNIDNSKAGKLLATYLRKTTEKYRFGHVLEMSYGFLKIEPKKNIDEYIKENLEIQFDGHPNEIYHLHMAEYLYSHLNRYYENPSIRN